MTSIIARKVGCALIVLLAVLYYHPCLISLKLYVLHIEVSCINTYISPYCLAPMPCPEHVCYTSPLPCSFSLPFILLIGYAQGLGYVHQYPTSILVVLMYVLFPCVCICLLPYFHGMAFLQYSVHMNTTNFRVSVHPCYLTSIAWHPVHLCMFGVSLWS